MPPDQTNLLQGTLDMMILKGLALGELVVSLSHRANHQRHIPSQAGSIFPALHRMEEEGWLVASWEESENKRRAKYYQLNQYGTAPTGSGDLPLGPHCAGDNPDTRSLLKETL